MAQDLIAFPVPLTDEQKDDQRLKEIFARQCSVSVHVIQIARQLYEARSEWIGGDTLPWPELTVLQRAHFMREIEDLVKRAKGEQ